MNQRHKIIWILICVIDYKSHVIDYQRRDFRKTIESDNPSKIWLCNRLLESCNRLPVKKCQKSFEKTHLFKLFWIGTMGLYICVCPYFKNKWILRELNFKNLSKHLGPKSCKLLRILLQVVPSTLKERNHFVHLIKFSCNQEIVCLLGFEKLEHKGEGSQGVFKDCKRFTRTVKSLKWVA